MPRRNDVSRSLRAARILSVNCEIGTQTSVTKVPQPGRMTRVAKATAPIGDAISLSDGVMNLTLLNFPEGAKGMINGPTWAGLHHFGFVVDSYEDHAVGRLEKNAAGKMAVTRVELKPKIVFSSGAKQPAAADLDWLHDKAHKECFIANSVTTEGHVVKKS